MFSLFGVAWVLSFSVKKALPRWHGSFVGKARNKAWKVAPMFFLDSVERKELASVW